MRSVSEVRRERRVFAHLVIGRDPEELALAFHLPLGDVLAIAERSSTDGALRSVEDNIVASFTRHGLPAPAPVRRTGAHLRPLPPTGGDQRTRIGATDILAAIASAAKACPSGLALSQEEYSQWRSEQCPGAPGIRTIRRRLGWGRAKQLALRALDGQEERSPGEPGKN